MTRTVTPPGPAGPSRFTRFNVVTLPPCTLAGQSLTELSRGGRTVRLAGADEAAYVAVMVTLEGTFTAAGVVIVKTTYVAPGGTVILDGTVAREVSDDTSLTTAPPAGAGPFRFTRFDGYEFPPAIEVGCGWTELIASGTSVSMPDLVTPSDVAVMVKGVEPVTAIVEMLKRAYVDPGETTTP